MKRLPLATCLLLLVGISACRTREAALPVGSGTAPTIEVYFSPKGGCTQAVVRALDGARKSVLVQAYSFTSKDISQALVEAHKRGVRVEALLDESQRTEKYSEADFLVDMGIPTRIDAKHAIAHNKVMVLDGQTVITGSFNFTRAAELNNAENLLVIRSPELAAKYTANWQAHADHCEPYQARQQGYSETHQTEPPKSPSPASAYFASKRSEVFHRQGCPSGAKIPEANIVRYATRDEAIRAGKKPCSECKP